jgi:hypothetical protein
MGGAVGWKRKRIARHESQGKEGSRQVAPAPEMSQEITSVDRETQELGTPGMLLDRRLAHPANADRRAQLLRAGQRTLGNRAVQRLIQAKLTVNPPGDRYEQEADRVARAVIRMPEPPTRDPTGGVESHPERLAPLPSVQLRVGAVDVGSKGGEAGPNVEAQVRGLEGGGRPLSPAVRAYFEPRFGHDFGAVRVHTGGRAVQAAHDVGARAFTAGRNIVFGSGEFAPRSKAGKTLIAHELAHVIQQSRISKSTDRSVAKYHSRSGSKHPEVTRSAGSTGGGLIQRAPKVFISTHGKRAHGAWARKFHQARGIATSNVGSIEEMLASLGSSWPKDGVRIVTHATKNGILLPLLRGGKGTLFEQDLTLRTRSALKKELAIEHPTIWSKELSTWIVEEAKRHVVRPEVVGKLWKAVNIQAHKPVLSTLGLTGLPAEGADAHSFLWWILDHRAIDDTSIIPKLPRRSQVLAYLKRNVDIFQNEVLAAASRGAPPARRGQLKKLIVGFRKSLQKAARAVVKTEKSEGPGFRRPGVPGRRYKSIQAAVKRGTYSKNLRKVQAAMPAGAKIQIRGCNIGGNTGWLGKFRDFFATATGRKKKRPEVSAPKLPHWYSERYVREGGRRVRKIVEWLQDGRRRIWANDPDFQRNIVKVR